LRGQPEEAMRLRVHLGLAPEPGKALSALDAFTMKEALSPQGEALWKDVMRQIERDRKDPLFECAPGHQCRVGTQTWPQWRPAYGDVVFADAY
jgi:hypothetical protein